MKAIWADGPRRGELVTLRTPHVVLPRQEAPAWLSSEAARDLALDEPEATIYSVTILRVGDRAFRLLMPPARSETMGVLALIDADPALVHQVEVAPS